MNVRQREQIMGGLEGGAWQTAWEMCLWCAAECCACVICHTVSMQSTRLQGVTGFGNARLAHLTTESFLSVLAQGAFDTIHSVMTQLPYTVRTYLHESSTHVLIDT